MATTAAAGAAARDEARKLVAMVHGDLAGGGKTEGAAVVFGCGDDRIYLVTAGHVVRTDEGPVTNLRVELRAPPGELLRAELLPHRDSDLDVAVLVVRNAAQQGVECKGFPFTLLGNAAELEAGDGVFSIGRAGGVPWWSNAAQDVVADRSSSHLYFQSALVGPGQSGGGVFDADWLLVGLVVGEGSSGSVKAARIDVVLDSLVKDGYPVLLRADTVAAAGCDTRATTFDEPNSRSRNASGGFFGIDQHVFSMIVGDPGSGDKRCVDCGGIKAATYRISATVWANEAAASWGVYLLEAQDSWFAFVVEPGGRASIKRYLGVRPTVLWTGAYERQAKDRLTLEAADGTLRGSVNGVEVGRADYDRRRVEDAAVGAGFVVTSGARVPATAWFDDYELVTCQRPKRASGGGGGWIPLRLAVPAGFQHAVVVVDGAPARVLDRLPNSIDIEVADVDRPVAVQVAARGRVCEQMVLARPTSSPVDICPGGR